MTGRSIAFALSAAVLVDACGGDVMVGVADPPATSSGAPPGQSTIAACPSRPDVAEQLVTVDAVSDVLEFAANDEHLVYVTMKADGKTMQLWDVTSGQAPVLIDETSAKYVRSPVVQDASALWSPWDGPPGLSADVAASVRRAPFGSSAGERAPLLQSSSILTLHELGPSDFVAATGSHINHLRRDGTVEHFLWSNAPEDDPDLWAVTSRHVYWVSAQSLYRADLATLEEEAVHAGPIFYPITADERRVYWWEESDVESRLVALDGDHIENAPATLVKVPVRVHATAMHATRSSLFVFDGLVGPAPATISRIDRASGAMTSIFEDIGESIITARFTPCSFVYSDGRSFWRRPLPP